MSDQFPPPLKKKKKELPQQHIAAYCYWHEICTIAKNIQTENMKFSNFGGLKFISLANKTILR